MDRAAIKEQCTYELRRGALYYVQSIDGQRVTYCRVGDVERRTMSLGRFAAFADRQVPNQ